MNSAVFVKVSTAMHWRAGNVKWPLVPRLGFFAAVGAVGGGYVAVHAPEEFLLGSSPQHSNTSRSAQRI